MSNAFASMLSRPAGTAEKPKPLPVGTYQLMVTKWETKESSQKKTPGIRFHYRVMQPGADVDQSMLPPNWSTKELWDDHWLTEDALYRFDEFLRKLGISLEGKEYKTVLANEVQGKTVMATVTQTPSTKPGDDTMYNNITDYAPAV